jgi:DNA invertase Pin-like site-specific DNA recombinase
MEREQDIKPLKVERFVAYYRVSTVRQGRSGLGLEAQQIAVEGYLRATSGRLLASFTEVESGKRNDRPQLREAILRAKVTGARVIIAKMDRLSRNAAFLLALRDSGVRFVATDLPNADETVVGIMAVIAQREREIIAQRTREALAVARMRLAKEGRSLGNPNGAAALRRADKGNGAAISALRDQADRKAMDLRAVLADIVANGCLSLAAVAAELNEREITTPRGGRWYPASVARLKGRLEHKYAPRLETVGQTHSERPPYDNKP